MLVSLTSSSKLRLIGTLHMAFSTVTAGAALANQTPTPGPAVRLHSLHSPFAQAKLQDTNFRVVHFVRHAQGFHNVNADYKNPKYLDAELTEIGIQQCRDLSHRLQNQQLEDAAVDGNMNVNVNVDCIIASPMRRALQTAYHSFEHILLEGTSEETPNSQRIGKNVPFVACEHWRETVNYVCDVRYPRTKLAEIFPYVDFNNIQHEDDPIFKHYEAKHGPLEEYTKHRESGDDEGLAIRARKAWRTIAERPQSERSLAVVSHSAFFMHMFTRPELGVVSYADGEVEALMMDGFENCELRSVAVETLY